MASRGAIRLWVGILEDQTHLGGSAGVQPLEEAAGALLLPRGLRAQHGPDGFVEHGFQASLGEG